MDMETNSRKRICLVTLSDNPDHQEVIYSLWKELDKLGIDAYTVGILNPSSLSAEHTEKNCYVDCPKRPGLSRDSFNLIKLGRMIREIKRINPDIIYIETVHLWNIAISMSMRKSAKIYQVVHDVDPHDSSTAVRLANSLCSKAADITVLRNKKDIPLASEKLGVAGSRIVHLDSWRAFPAYRPLKYTREFLFFGRLRRYKGLQSMFSIAKSLPEIRFRVLGKSDFESLDLVNKMSALPNVTVIEGFIPERDMAEAFLYADWVVVPYESASQSGVIMDAYRYSRPVISFNVGAISEQIVDGKTGYLISPGDIEGFISAVRSAASMPKGDLEAFSRGAYQYGQEKYGSIGAARRFLEMIG